MDYCWSCKYPNATRDWKVGDPVPPMVRKDETGRPLDTVKVCEKCGGCLVGMVRQESAPTPPVEFDWSKGAKSEGGIGVTGWD